MVTSKEANRFSVRRFLSTCLMFLCLTLLTSMNFFLFGFTKADTGLFCVNVEECESKSNYPPAGPSEDKSGNTGSFSFSEEIIHESNPEFNFSTNNFFYLHHIADAEKIEMIHPERMLPPPKH